jgi:hypothetical protein
MDEELVAGFGQDINSWVSHADNPSGRGIYAIEQIGGRERFGGSTAEESF